VSAFPLSGGTAASLRLEAERAGGAVSACPAVREHDRVAARRTEARR